MGCNRRDSLQQLRYTVSHALSDEACPQFPCLLSSDRTQFSLSSVSVELPFDPNSRTKLSKVKTAYPAQARLDNCFIVGGSIVVTKLARSSAACSKFYQRLSRREVRTMCVHRLNDELTSYRLLITNRCSECRKKKNNDERCLSCII